MTPKEKTWYSVSFFSSHSDCTCAANELNFLIASTADENLKSENKDVFGVGREAEAEGRERERTHFVVLS